MFTNAMSMLVLGAMLASSRRRVIIPDLLGSDFGGSCFDTDCARRTNLATHVASLHALIDTLGLSTLFVSAIVLVLLFWCWQYLSMYEYL